MYKAISSFHLFHLGGRQSASKSSFSVARTCPTRAELAFDTSACLSGIWRVAGKFDFLTCFSIRCIAWVTCLLTPCLKIHFNHDSTRMLCTDLCNSSIQARGTRNQSSLILLYVIFLTYMCCPWLCSHGGWLLLKCSAVGIGFNGAETNCGIARIVGILLMNSFDT